MSLRRILLAALFALAALLLFAFATGGVLFVRQGGFAPYRVPSATGDAIPTTPALLAQGEYVARLGNCAGCHSVRGGEPFSGGRAFTTPWGTLFSTNLTPDPRSGLGDWSAAEFRHAMRNGVSSDGVLYPAFPYAHFALLSDADLDALFAWLRQLPANARAPIPNRLEFPASWRPAQVIWRMLYYRPQNSRPDPDRSAQWQRGRYLVDGLGHCAMCHGTRGRMESLPSAGYLAGGRIPGMDWYAPPLDQDRLKKFSTSQLADYLRSGTSMQGMAYGPMAEVIYDSLRYLTRDDALAIAVFLKSLPPRAPIRANAAAQTTSEIGGQGAALYKHHCADCHAGDGRGRNSDYPPVAGSVAVSAADPVNLVRLILYGAMPPTTVQNPRPHSMPPFVQQLDSADIATLTNYIRVRWSDQPSVLTASEIDALHGIMIQ